MTTEDDGVNWTVYRTEFLTLPRHSLPYIDRLLACMCGARVRLRPFPALG